MLCDICGSESKLYRTKIEGTEMNLCAECSKFGEVLWSIEAEQKKEKKAANPVKVEEKPEAIKMVMADFSEKIKKKREQLGLDQEKFAKMINQKKSVVHKLENKELTPSIDLAKKLEKILKIQLVETYAEDRLAVKKSSGENITVGDVIKIKTKKNI